MGFWEWVAKVFLDGFAGGLVGALVTGGAVIWTVRHERLIRERADCKAEVDQVRRTIAEMHSKVADLRWMQFGDEVDLRNGVLRLRSELLLAETSVRRTSPESASRLRAIRADLELLPRNSADLFSKGVVHDFRERSEAVLVLVLEKLEG